MFRTSSWMAVWLLVLTGTARAADGSYAIKVASTPPPMELAESVRTLMSDQSVQLLDSQGMPMGEVWFRKQLSAKATPEQVKNGLTYRELEESTLLGAVRFDQLYTDYRKQKIRPGIYTLRLGFQPMDGDHMGTAPYSEFALLLPAARDLKPDPIDTDRLHEQSARSTPASHPGIMLLYPNEKPTDMPVLVDMGMNTMVLNVKQVVLANGQKANLGIGLTVIGHTTAE